MINKKIKAVPVLAFYSGLSGFYCSVFPTNNSLRDLQKIVRSNTRLSEVGVVPALMHCTLIYSPELSISISDLPWINRNQCFPAVVKAFSVFGEKQDTLVAELDAPQLTAYHDRLAALGLEETWDTYRPHVTLAYDLNSEEANLLAASLAPHVGLKIQLTAPIFQDIN